MDCFTLSVLLCIFLHLKTLPHHPGSEGASEKLQITRNQLPIQPAFAVTGHSAQEKTLPKVLISLHEGGFAAYVAASHAQTCYVTLEQLNKPLPSDLLQEHGFRDGTFIDVPDAEADYSMKHLIAIAAEFDTNILSVKMKQKFCHEQ
ncbi:hypothetical protein BDR04DRAFT_1121493 [Suillus decipiens]|nr:hypothetical protein BDR04DRAFT_1121493 [Suillus decipiens]